MVHDHPHKHSVSVSAIIFNDNGEVLATQRRDTGAWVPPGGAMLQSVQWLEAVRGKTGCSWSLR